MQAAGLVVDRVEAGGLARKAPPRIHRRLDHFQRAERRLAEGLRLAARRRAFGHAVEIGLGHLDLAQRFDLVRRVQRPFHEIAPHAHQFAQQREVIDLVGQFARVQQALAVGRQLRQIGRAPQLLQRLVALEIGLERNRRRHRIAVQQLEHAFIDALVHRLVEMIRHQRRGQFLDHLVVDQHGAQKGRFRFQVGGQHGTFRRSGIGRIVGAEEEIGIGHARLMPAAGSW